MSSDDRTTPASQLFDRFLAQQSSPGALSFDEFAARHAEHAAALREHWSAWRQLQQVREHALGLGPSESSARARAATALALAKLAEHSARGARYEVRGELGGGGMGVVREVWDQDLRRSLAMKVIRGEFLESGSDADSSDHDHVLQRFFEEAQITAQLGHPGVVPVHEIGVDSAGRPFFTMARVQGEDLGRILARVRAGEPEWSTARAIGVLQRVCETMAFAHSRGVIHRDLKPANVMVGAYGEVYVMDWGLARVEGSPSVAAVATDRREQIAGDPNSPLASGRYGQPGTLCYMAPEQASNRAEDVGPRSDVYSAGAMLYEMLAGHAPYLHGGRELTRDELRKRVLAGPPPLVDDVAPGASAELAAICNKAMAASPDARYPGMGAMASDVRAWLEGRVVTAHRTGAWVELTKWVRRNRGTAAAIGVALALLAGSSAVVAAKNSELAQANVDLQAETSRANAARADAESASALANLNAAKAEEQRRLAQAQLAETEYRGVQIARSHGRWRDVLTAVERARAAGYPDEVALEFEAAQAHRALVHNPEANEIVDRLLAREDLGARRGSLLLLRGDLLMADRTRAEDALRAVTEARAAGLSQAEDLFAAALLAKSIPEAAGLMRRSVVLDPFHPGALSHLLTMLFFLGRYDEALTEAELMTRYFPDDPNPYAVRAAIHAYRSEPELARAEAARCAELGVRSEYVEQTERLIEAVNALGDLRQVESWLGGPPTAAQDDLLWLQQAIFGPWLSTSKRAKAESDSPEAIPVALPALREGLVRTYKVAMQLQNQQMLDFFGGWEKAAERAKEALEVYPDAMLHYFYGGCQLSKLTAKFSSLSTSERAAGMAEVEASFRAAYESHSFLLPGVQRVNRYWASYAELFLIKLDDSESLGEWRDLFRSNVAWLARQTNLSKIECETLCSQLVQVGLDPRLGEPLFERLEQMEGANPAFVITFRAHLAIARGAWGEAHRAVEQLAKEFPNDGNIPALREKTLAGMKSIAEQFAALSAGG